MTVLEPQRLVLKNVVLTLGSGTPDDFAKYVSSVTFTPSASTITWTGLGGNTYTDVATATWTCDLAYLQDWTSTNSLSQYLFNHEGDTVPATFEPKNGGPSFTASIVITPGAIGGDVNAYATATVSLGVVGKPVLVPGA